MYHLLEQTKDRYIYSLSFVLFYCFPLKRCPFQSPYVSTTILEGTLFTFHISAHSLPAGGILVSNQMDPIAQNLLSLQAFLHAFHNIEIFFPPVSSGSPPRSTEGAHTFPQLAWVGLVPFIDKHGFAG